MIKWKGVHLLNFTMKRIFRISSDELDCYKWPAWWTVHLVTSPPPPSQQKKKVWAMLNVFSLLFKKPRPVLLIMARLNWLNWYAYFPLMLDGYRDWPWCLFGSVRSSEAILIKSNTHTVARVSLCDNQMLAAPAVPWLRDNRCLLCCCLFYKAPVVPFGVTPVSL